MPIKNIEISHLCQVGVLTGTVASVVGSIYGHAVVGSSLHAFATPQAASLCSFVLTNAAFLAFPTRRRSDLVTIAALLASLTSLASPAFGGRVDGLWLAASLGGAYGTYMATFIEALRAATRDAPNSAFSLFPRSTSRRCGGARRSAAAAAASQAAQGAVRMMRSITRDGRCSA